ncbi:MAG: TldD/PmbA family protein [Methanomassiliicoccales archaeon]|jgi:PmbA protein|nr:TldD/PmbA family protein [Methanomassiliicoccales archaeon]
MKAEDICQLVLRLCKAQGVSDTVVSVAQAQGSMVRFSNNEVTVVDELMDTTVGIYVNDHGRRAGTSTADLSRRSLEAAARKVVETARKGPASTSYAPLPQGPFTYDPRLLDSSPVASAPKELVGMARQAIDSAVREGADRVAGSLTADNGKITLQTSAGAFGVMHKSGLEVSLRAFCGDSSGHSMSVSGNKEGFDPAKAGEEAGRLAKLSLSPAAGESGTYDAVLGPMVFADLVNQIGRSASAFMVEAGLSFLGGKIGQKVGADILSVSDDPTLEGSYGSTPFDAEGLPSRNNRIIDAGVLRTYLHNSSTAARAATASTANAGLVAPRAFNLVVGEGQKGLEEMISTVDRGIYVTNNWYLRYQNYSTGDFSTIPRDAMFLIEKGQLSKPIKELRISDNLLRIFGAVSALTKERRWVHWWEVETPTLAPSALVTGMRFTKSR